jgi:hypothetical protein
MINLLNELKEIKSDKPLLVVNASESFLQKLEEYTLSYHTDIEENEYEHIVIFGISNEEIMEFSSMYLEFISEDGLTWLCYPKTTSEKYPLTNCNWDTVSLLLKEYDFKPIEQLDVNTDFIAISFKN